MAHEKWIIHVVLLFQQIWWLIGNTRYLVLKIVLIGIIDVITEAKWRKGSIFSL